jgi:hypothetical protein
MCLVRHTAACFTRNNAVFLELLETWRQGSTILWNDDDGVTSHKTWICSAASWHFPNFCRTHCDVSPLPSLIILASVPPVQPTAAISTNYSDAIFIKNCTNLPTAVARISSRIRFLSVSFLRRDWRVPFFYFCLVSILTASVSIRVCIYIYIFASSRVILLLTSKIQIFKTFLTFWRTEDR